VISLQVWPPVEPVLSGPCPACRCWLVVDLHNPPQQTSAIKAPAAPNTAAVPPVDAVSPPAEPAAREDQRQAHRIRRSGAFDPMYMPTLARQGKLLPLHQPDFEAKGTSRDRVEVKQRTDRWMKYLGMAASVTVIVAGTLLAWQSLRNPAGVKAAQLIGYTPPPPDHGEGTAPLPDEIAAEARKTLAAIAAAKSAREVLPWVLDQERIAARVDSYYRKGVQEPALEADQFTAHPLSLRDWAQGIAVLERTMANGQPLLLFLRRDKEARDGRFLLDWETYIQEKENLVARFVSAESKGEGIFRVILRRQHLFADQAAPQRFGQLGVGLRTLHGQLLETPAVIHPGENLYDRFTQQLAWGQPQIATVKLAWERSGKDPRPRLTVKELVCWELAGVGGVPEIPLPAPQALAEAR